MAMLAIRPTKARLVPVIAALALAALATVGISWCLSAISHPAEHCHGCGSGMGMDVAEHLAWWQSQTQSTPAAAEWLLPVLLLALVAIAPVLRHAAAPVLASSLVRRFRPPGWSYLSLLLADGLLNPKSF